MELRHLRHFIAVAEELHFVRAAERLGMEQSPLSRSIRDLEEEVGVVLLARTTRSTRLTAGGQAFLRDARQILLDVDSAVHSAREAALGRNTRLALSFTDGLATNRVACLLAAIRKEADLEVRVIDVPGERQLTALRAGQIDLAISMRDADGADIRSEPLWTERLAAVLPSGHRLAAASHVDIAQLKDDPIVMCHPDLGSGCYGQLMTAFRLAGVEPKISEYVFQRATTLAMVAAGFGVGIATMDVDGETTAGTVLRSLTGPKTQLTVYGVSRVGEVSEAVASALVLARAYG